MSLRNQHTIIFVPWIFLSHILNRVVQRYIPGVALYDSVLYILRVSEHRMTTKFVHMERDLALKYSVAGRNIHYFLAVLVYPTDFD